MEMSCPWVSNRLKKTSENTMNYAPLRWGLKQKYSGYEISLSQHQCRHSRGLVDRRRGSGEGASWKVSQKRPQEDAEGMPIRHTEHLHLLLR